MATSVRAAVPRRALVVLTAAAAFGVSGCADDDSGAAAPGSSTSGAATAVSTAAVPVAGARTTLTAPTSSPATTTASSAPVTSSSVVSVERGPSSTAPVTSPRQGINGVRVVRLPLVDDSRTTPANGDPVAPLRELPTTVYLPPQQAPAPLVVLAHGYNGHPDKFTDLANHWAANGFVVAVPRFPMSYAGTPHSSMGDVDGQAGDITFVIDEMLRLARTDERFDDRIDADRIGVFGLSLGSLTVWNTAFGQCCGDDRIDALIQSDGWLPLPVERIDRPLPVMVIHSDADPIFPYDEVRSTVEQLPSSPVMLTVHGAMHAAVGENTPTPADQAYRIATTVFWRRHLCGRPDEPFPAEVQIDGVATLDE